MEIDNITPEKFLKILNRGGIFLCAAIFIYRFPEIANVLTALGK